MAFLNETGLAYYDSLLKAYIAGLIPENNVGIVEKELGTTTFSAPSFSDAELDEIGKDVSFIINVSSGAGALTQGSVWVKTNEVGSGTSEHHITFKPLKVAQVSGGDTQVHVGEIEIDGFAKTSSATNWGVWNSVQPKITSSLTSGTIQDFIGLTSQGALVKGSISAITNAQIDALFPSA